MENLEVYFSKLPKSCLECPCFQSDEMCCGLDDGTQDYFKDEIDGGKCPLKKIHSHDLLSKKIDSLSKENSHLKAQLHKEKQQAVNEVCEKIIERYNLEGKPITGAFGDTQYGYVMVSAKDLKQFLNKIQKEQEK